MKDEKRAKKALIYCRVSTTKQVVRGDGLSSQETRCREFAKYRGYQVVEVFKDDMSGSRVDRPGMKAMLSYLREHKNEEFAVIIDDISRLARGLEAHLQLRASIGTAGGILESPSIEFGEDSDSKLVENMLASVSEHHRRKNAEQTRNRMRARVMNGYWPFKCPIGYHFKKVTGRGSMLVVEEPYASIVREGLEGFASGRFQLQAEVKRFFESFPEFPRDRTGQVRNERVSEMLMHPVYAGCVEARVWDVSLRKGQHEAIVSFETYRKIQDRLNGHAKVPARSNLNADFPLRGFVTCGHCDRPLTACWSVGRSDRYAYYQCFRRGCESYRKSIRREVLEGEFEALLRRLRPSESLFRAAHEMLRDLWTYRLGLGETRAAALQTELAKTQRQIDQLVDRITETQTSSVIAAYEKRVRELEERKIEIAEKIGKCGRPVRGLDETVRTALSFLSNPWNLWASERLEDKRAVLKLTFAERLAYVRNEGFRTAELAFPFKCLTDVSLIKKTMASRAGFEPAYLP